MIKAISFVSSIAIHKKISLLVVFLLIATAGFGQSWQQRGSDIIGKANTEGIGNSVSLSQNGKILAIGAAGANSLTGLARIYEWNGSAWSQKGSDINGSAGGEQFGWSVSLDSSGETIAVGAPYADASFGSFSNAGTVRIYSWSGSSWVQKGSDINAIAANDNCGVSVSISNNGNTIAIGSPGSAGGGTGRGIARIFTWNGSAWIQKGTDISGEADYDISANSVSIDASGNKIAIGAPFNSDVDTYAGHTRVYSWTGSAWVQQGSDINGDADSDNFGNSVSLSKDGLRLVVGAPQDFTGGYGYFKIFDWNGSSWVQKGSTITSGIDADEFGYAVHISGNSDYVVAGARGSATGNEKGRAELYSWSGSKWQLDYTAKGTEDYEAAGHDVCLNYNGDVFALSSPSYNGSATALGNVQVYRYTPACTETYSTFTANACGSYTWNSTNYFSSGTYMDTLTNASGCDSIMTLKLTIMTPELKTMAAAICGGTYTSPTGKKYNSSGIYSDTIKNMAGTCDSIIFHISLTKKIPNADGFVLHDSTITPLSESSVVHGDIDNDGDEDLLISGKDVSYALIAEIYTNNGYGIFTKLTANSFTGAKTGSVSIVDIDGDSLPEIFISGLDVLSSPVAYMYKNNGNGSFTQLITAPFDKIKGTKHAFADLDKDGDQDLLISSGDSILLYKNNGGSFASTFTVVTASKADNGFIITGDVNADGYPDIIKSGSDQNANELVTELLVNNKLNGFTAFKTFAPLALSSGALADFNGDGKIDFINSGLSKNFTLQTRIYSGNDNGGFTSIDSTSLKGFIYGSLLAEDFNNDGKTDVLLTGNADFSTPQARLYIKDNTDKFVFASNLPIPGLQMGDATVFDIDNDGLKDLMVTGQDQSYQPVTMLYKNKGCFAPCETESEITVKNCGSYTSPSGNYVWTESGTYIDVVKNASGCDSTITIHLQTQSFSSLEAVACDSFKAPSGKVYHISGLYKDILIGANQFGCDSIINLDLNISSGQKFSKINFSEIAGFSLPGYSYEKFAGDIRVADWVGDNKPDIATFVGSEFHIYQNNGGGSFTDIVVPNILQLEFANLDAGDIDGDGKTDLIISGSLTLYDLAVKLYKNNGNGSFSEITGNNFPQSFGAVKIADLVGDSKPDILFTGTNVSGIVAPQLFKNDGGGSFSEVSGTNFQAVVLSSIATGDVNGDGKLDVLISGSSTINVDSATTKLYINNGNGTFAKPPGTNFIGIFNGSLQIADLVGDSKPDILVSGGISSGRYYYNATKLYKNNGNGTFTEVSGTNLPDLRNVYISVADVDGDKKQDILMTGTNSLARSDGYTRVWDYSSYLFKNKGNGVFIEIDANLPKDDGRATALTDLDGDNRPDIIVRTDDTPGELFLNTTQLLASACIAPTGCNTYTSPSGKYTWVKSGVYTDTLNMKGYDSIITVNLLIDSIEAKFIPKSDPEGKFNALIVNKSKGKNMRFVWHFGDGDSSMLPTPTHTYANAGTYSLCLTVTTGKGCVQKFCTDLTFHGKKDGPYTISVIDSIDGTMATGIKESPVAGDINLSFSIYPNPATNMLNIVNNEYGVFDVSVLDLSGRRMFSQKHQQGRALLSLSGFKAGMYIIEIHTRNGNGYYKILKQ